MNQKEAHDSNLAAWLGDEDKLHMEEPLTLALDNLYAAGPDASDLTRAKKRLSRALARLAEKTVHFDILADSLLGDIFLAMSPRGLCALNFGLTEHDFLAQLTRELKSRGEVIIQRSPTRVAEAARQVKAYLEGRITEFNLEVDLAARTAFQRQVLHAAAQVPRGQVATYGDLARRLGKPRGARAVGQALGRNPVPIVIPCHRVIAADGSLGGYSGGGGLHSKALLLHLEGAQI